LYIHLGVIFQAPLPGDTIVIAEPLISYRMGNTNTFSPRTFEMAMFILPSLVWSLALSDSAKNAVCSREPWRDPKELLIFRGCGFYGIAEYRRWVRPRLRSLRERFTLAAIALVPGMFVNVLIILYYSLARRQDRGMWLYWMRISRFYPRNWAIAAC
jgi:hypothetical protein